MKGAHLFTASRVQPPVPGSRGVLGKTRVGFPLRLPATAAERTLNHVFIDAILIALLMKTQNSPLCFRELGVGVVNELSGAQQGLEAFPRPLPVNISAHTTLRSGVTPPGPQSAIVRHILLHFNH